MKAGLISIQPKWVELIASGKKTIEVRKTRPKLETPFKVYIYETKGKQVEHLNGCDITYYGRGRVIGEFVCDRIYATVPDYNPPMAKFFNYDFYNDRGERLQDCLTSDELSRYGDGATLYGWHITDLKIYDKPKELSEFWTTGHCFNHENTEIVENIMGEYVEQCWKNSFCRRCRHLDDFGGCGKRGKQLTRPPQSWCYVEELQNG